jgi:hypothetical protein
VAGDYGECGFIDKSGSFAIKPRFDSATVFSEGLAPVALGKKWGYVDHDGVMRIEPRFQQAMKHVDGLAAVRLDGKWGYVNRAGNLTIKPRFKEALSFHGGLARVCDDYWEGWDYVDAQGGYVWKRPGRSVDSVAASVMRCTSRKYQVPGFGKCRFGMSAEEVSELSSADDIPLSEGHQHFYTERGCLVGYERRFTDDNETHLTRLRRLFGPVSEDSLVQARSLHGGLVSSADIGRNRPAMYAATALNTTLARYCFPQLIAYVMIENNRRADAIGQNLSSFDSEAVWLMLFDREWVMVKLSEDIAEKREVLQWVRRTMSLIDAGQIDLSNIASPKAWDFCHNPPKAGKAFETARVDGTQGEPFIVVAQAHSAWHDRPKGSYSIAVNLGNMPGRRQNDLRTFTVLAADISLCNSLITQEAFPPAASVVRTVKEEDHFAKRYEWEAAGGWQVRVGPSDDFYFLKTARQ